MKKFVKILSCTVLGLILVAVIAASFVWRKEISSIAGIRQVDSMVYRMDYKADYDLDDLINADIDENRKLVAFVIGKLSRGLYKPEVKVAGQTFACTSFQSRNSEGDGWLFGRNYDFFKKPVLVVESHPKNGYASLSACDLGHLGYGVDKLPDSFSHKAMCIASIYAPMDGINEKGLCVSIMALPKQAAYQNTGKHVVGTSILIRLLLDRCATVQEAIDLISKYDIRHDQKAGSGYHYMVADAGGDCAVIEFDLKDNWKTMIVRKAADAKYMHVTNHLLTDRYYTTEPNPEFGNPRSHSWERYAKVAAYLDERDGVTSLSEAQECLANVHWTDLPIEGTDLLENTVYSNVYDQTSKTLYIRPWSDYDKTITFKLNK